MKKTTKRHLIVLLVFTGALATVTIFLKKNPKKNEAYFESLSKVKSNQDIQSHQANQAKSTQSWVPGPSSKSGESRRGLAQSQVSLKSFRSKLKAHGFSLKPVFNEEGKLIQLQGKPHALADSQRSFDPRNEAQVRDRATAVIEAFRSELGLDDRTQLELSSVKPGQFTAQVTFEQRVDGLIVHPRGKIHLRFGPQGELMGMESSAVSAVQVQNQFSMDMHHAKTLAFESVSRTEKEPAYHSDKNTPSGTDQKLLWVPSWKSSNPEGFKAYRFQIAGREVVIDGQSGQILMNKNKKIY